MPSLQDKIALVTGSTSGIGRGIAAHFAGLGAQVVVHGPDTASSNAAAEALRASGHEVDAVAGDLTNVEACREVIRSVVARRGGIDVLVNNAGNTARGSLEDSTAEFWDAMMAVNLRAPFICLQEALRSMKARGAARLSTSDQSTRMWACPISARTRCRKAG